jgi:DNA-binding NarL/FixJ family response regulator
MPASKLSIIIPNARPQSVGFALDSLTTREVEVGHWLSCGKTNREIAVLLRASPRTIDKHVEHIFAKLHVENRTTAAVMLTTDRIIFVNGKPIKQYSGGRIPR